MLENSDYLCIVDKQDQMIRPIDEKFKNEHKIKHIYRLWQKLNVSVF